MNALTADRWLMDVLKGDPTMQGLIGNRIFVDVAPRGTPMPFVVAQFVSGLPADNAYADHIYFDEVWLVKAVAEGNDYTALEPVDARIGELLHKTSDAGPIGSGGAVVMCAQEDIVRFSELDESLYKHLGHYYRIYTQ